MKVHCCLIRLLNICIDNYRVVKFVPIYDNYLQINYPPRSSSVACADQKPFRQVDYHVSKHIYEIEGSDTRDYWEPAKEMKQIFDQMNSANLLEIPRKFIQ